MAIRARGGLSGRMAVIIDGKKHSYEFDYDTGE